MKMKETLLHFFTCYTWRHTETFNTCAPQYMGGRTSDIKCCLVCFMKVKKMRQEQCQGLRWTSCAVSALSFGQFMGTVNTPHRVQTRPDAQTKFTLETL